MLGVCGLVLLGLASGLALWLRRACRRRQRSTESKGEQRGKLVPSKAKENQEPKDKARARLEWWQRLNEVKPALVLPGLRIPRSGQELEPAVYGAVARMVQERVDSGRDWLVRDSDYGEAPAHASVKEKVNTAILQTVLETFGDSLADQMMSDPLQIILLLDTPQYGTLSKLAGAMPKLRHCQQVIIPQADLRHYFEMLRGDSFYVGVRAQRLDHWLCANAGHGFQCLVAFLDYECRLAGARSARLCPAADVMRFFRFGFAGAQAVLAITVGLEEPAPRPEDVDAFIKWEAHLNGYEAVLKESWKYRMVSLLYVVRKL